MKHSFPMTLVALVMATLAGAVQAQVAFAAKDVHLRAGPARDYPVVAVVPAGFQLLVQGCLPNYTWCDVVAGANRGWVYAGNISYTYQGATVPLLNYGTFIGIGVLGFVLNDYWSEHYRTRPWYPERDRWVIRPHVRPAPRLLPPPRDVHPQRPRPHPGAAPIGPLPQRPAPGAGPRAPGQPLPGVTPRPPREAQPRAPRPDGPGPRGDGPGRGDRPQR